MTARRFFVGLAAVVALLLAACGGSKSSSPAATAAVPTSTTAPSALSDAAVWQQGLLGGQFDRALTTKMNQQCFPSTDKSQQKQQDCIAQTMQASGASAAAVDFYRKTGWFLVGLHRYGGLAVGDIFLPFRANDNEQYVVAGSGPDLVFVEDTGSKLKVTGDADYAKLKAIVTPVGAVPPNGDLSIWPGDNAFEGTATASSGGPRLIFQYSVVDFCHACGTGYWERVGFDFDKQGVFQTTTLLGLCRQATAPSAIPGVANCPKAVPR